MHPSSRGPAAVPLAPWKRNWSARSADHERAAGAGQPDLTWQLLSKDLFQPTTLTLAWQD